MESILIFGAGELQISLIKNVKEMGYRAVVIDPNPEAEGRTAADVFEIVAADDFDATLSIAKEHDVAALVTAATDNPLPMMARIAERLNLRFPSYESVISVLDKAKFKNILQENQIPCAVGNSYHVSETPDYSRINFPVIIKPNQNSGSRGVVRCKSREELALEIKNVAKFCRDGRYIVEEFIEGDEISVEGFVHNGKLEIIQITDKVLSPPPYNVEMAHIQPSKYSNLKDKIATLLQRVIDAAGLDNCAIHPELKINSTGIYIIELGPRLGGDFITSDLVPLSTGINMEKNLIRLALGMPLSLSCLARASMIQYLALPLGMQVKTEINESQIKSIAPTVTRFCFYLKLGDEAKLVTNSLNRHGYWIMEGPNFEDINKNRQTINKRFPELL